ncbi:MAG: hypothetical protein V1851_02890 [Patescibacteria group bacterium]
MSSVFDIFFQANNWHFLFIVFIVVLVIDLAFLCIDRPNHNNSKKEISERKKEETLEGLIPFSHKESGIGNVFYIGLCPVCSLSKVKKTCRLCKGKGIGKECNILLIDLLETYPEWFITKIDKIKLSTGEIKFIK